MQIEYPGWPPETVTKNCVNTKKTLSQDLLVDIDPTLCQSVSCMKPLYFLCSLGFQDGCHLLILKNAQNMKMTISQ